ncbi:MAG TPA: phage holin family protein [Gammaproteobacteria bacterium]
MSASTTDVRRRERSGLRSVSAYDYQSTPSLLRRLADDVSRLLAQEVALLKAETTKSIGDLKAGIASIAVGGAVAFMGAFFLLLAAVYGLSNVVQPWLAALIVGGVVTLIGVIMLATGRRKLEPTAVAPRRTAESLRKDTEMIKGVSQHEHD